MASRLLFRNATRMQTATAFSCVAGGSLLFQRPLRCDGPMLSSGFSQYQRDARVPIVTEEKKINPRAVRQISTGSIAGLAAGLAVSVFSKPLTFLIGLLACGIALIESRGIHIIPYGRIQSFFSRRDVRSTVQDNLALKLSFGTAFALAGFAKLD